MSDLRIPRPEPDESSPYFQLYISQVADERIGQALLSQIEELEALLAPLDEKAALARYAPGKWSVKEVVGHLSDSERIFEYRMLRVARGDATPMEGFDENAYVPAGSFDQRTLGSLLAEFRAVRQGTLALLEGMSPDWLTRRGTASGKPVSARALVYIIVGHTTHHMRVLRERYGLGAKSEAAATA